MKEFKIKISKNKNIFTKLFTVFGLVFITSNTFIYGASAQAMISNEEFIFTKLLTVFGLAFIISNTFIYSTSAQAMISNEELIKVKQKIKKEDLTSSDTDRTSRVSPLATQDYIDILKKSMDQTIEDKDINDPKAYSKIFSLSKSEWKKVLDTEKSKKLGKLDLKDPKYCIERGHDTDKVKHIVGGTTYSDYNYINFICDYSNDTVLVYKVKLRILDMSISPSATGTNSGSSSRFITKEEFFKEYKLNKNETVLQRYKKVIIK